VRVLRGASGRADGPVRDNVGCKRLARSRLRTAQELWTAVVPTGRAVSPRPPPGRTPARFSPTLTAEGRTGCQPFPRTGPSAPPALRIFFARKRGIAARLCGGLGETALPSERRDVRVRVLRGASGGADGSVRDNVGCKRLARSRLRPSGQRRKNYSLFTLHSSLFTFLFLPPSFLIAPHPSLCYSYRDHGRCADRPFLCAACCLNPYPYVL